MQQRQAETVRVLLADEQWLFREAARVALDTEPDLVVVAQACTATEVVVQAQRASPDVVILDALLGLRGRGSVVSAILERRPDARVVVLSEDESVPVLIDAMEDGASGYLSKHAPVSDLIAVTRRVAEGDMVVPPGMLRPLVSTLLARRREADEGRRRLAPLTPREREVLALIAQGRDNDAIAQVLVISPETARTHIHNLLSKLGLHSRLEAAAFVLQNGLYDELAAVRA